MIALLTFIAALGAGLNAGVFFAFSTFVMPALGRLTAREGITAMNAINVMAINRWFMGALFGTAALCLLLALHAAFTGSGEGAKYRLLGGVAYVLGAIAVTRVFNIPLNDALAAVSPDSAAGAQLWQRYLTEWCAWNHVRGGASLVAAALLTFALLPPRTLVLRALGALVGAVVLTGCNTDELGPFAPHGASVPVERLSALGLFVGRREGAGAARRCRWGRTEP